MLTPVAGSLLKLASGAEDSLSTARHPLSLSRRVEAERSFRGGSLSLLQSLHALFLALLRARPSQPLTYPRQHSTVANATMRRKPAGTPRSPVPGFVLCPKLAASKIRLLLEPLGVPRKIE